jgi:hypothetical protein
MRVPSNLGTVRIEQPLQDREVVLEIVNRRGR